MSGITIQLKKGTAPANVILGAGELGYDTQWNALKIGDGSTQWSNLDEVRFPKRSTLAIHHEYYLSLNATNDIFYERLLDLNSEQSIYESYLHLDRAETGAPGGLKVHRGDLQPAYLLYDTVWKIGVQGSLSPILTESNHIETTDPHPDTYLPNVATMGNISLHQKPMQYISDIGWHIASDIYVDGQEVSL